MPKLPAHTDTAAAWGEVLAEAREIRNRQDARLASAQRQSQLIVAGFLAMTAIFVTAVSVYVASQPENTATPIDLQALAPSVAVGFAAAALANGVAWILTHFVARRWRDVADFGALTAYPGSVDGLPRMQRHLVHTLLDHFSHNNVMLRRAQRVVGAQAMLTLAFIYSISYIGSLFWVLR